MSSNRQVKKMRKLKVKEKRFSNKRSKKNEPHKQYKNINFKKDNRKECQ